MSTSKDTIEGKSPQEIIEMGQQQMQREIMEKGYVYLNNGKTTKVYMLRKHFPSIQMARVKGKSIAFLPDKKEEAMRAMLKKFDKKVWSYQELRAVTKLFGSDLKREEKQKLVEKDSDLKGTYYQ